MVRSRDPLRRTDPLPSVFPLLVNRAKLRQRNALHTLAIALEGAMVLDEHTPDRRENTRRLGRPGFPILERSQGPE